MARLHTTLPALACAAALGLSACGDEEPEGDPIPGDVATEINKQIASISDRYRAAGGACGDIPENFDSIRAAVRQIPDSVSSEVRDALESSIDRLEQLTQDCDETKGQETETTPTETAPEITVPTVTQTVPVEPTTPETTPQTTPDQGEGNNGNGNGGGQGSPGNGGANAPGGGE